MKPLLISTALVALVATPVAAQTDSSSQTGSQTQAQMEAQSHDKMTVGETFEASELMDKRLFMRSEGTADAGSQAGQSQQDNQTNTQTGSAEAENGSDMAMTQNRENWRMVGEIEDVILSSKGKALGLVVDSGGFLGRDKDGLRISIEDVRFVPADQSNRNNLSDQVGNVSTQNQQNTTTQGLEQQSQSGQQDAFSVLYTGDRRTFEESENYDEDPSTQAGETLGSEKWGERTRDEYQQVDREALTTDELRGAAVYGSNDEWVADVSELALGTDGEINNVIVDVGGFLGIGEKPVALSMDDVELRRGDGSDLRAYVSYTEEELDSMETWEGDS